MHTRALAHSHAYALLRMHAHAHTRKPLPSGTNLMQGGNILSDGNGNVKLADFGAAKHLEILPLLTTSQSD